MSPHRLTSRVCWNSLVCLLFLAGAGCSGNDWGEGFGADRGCSSCHGNDVNAAPPLGLQGEESTDEVAVGAHQAHLVDGALRRAVGCDECHVVPAATGDDGHVDPLPAELTWGALAAAGGVTPRWDRDAVTCSSVYCHGATLAGGGATAPSWTVVDGSQVTCDGCHGNPPPAPHPLGADCHVCHGETVKADGTIDVAGGRHIDGRVDGPGEACNGCHGSDRNAAPPADLRGGDDTAELGVGAHQAHLVDGDIRRAVACSECHRVPSVVAAEGHLDDLPADVTWGSLARTGGLRPEWDRTSARCASTYCHGASLSGGTATAPAWTTVDGSQSACDSCHGAPPPLPHPSSEDCAACHPGTVTAGGRIDVAGGHHIDGVVDVLTACNTCHGSETNAAPPVSTMGESDAAAVAVGAHQSHLRDGAYRAALGCADCHVVPTSLGQAGHIDEAPAEVVWGALATTAGATPGWDRDAETCASTYCHGATLGGGRNTAPLWTVVDGSQVACDTCHGDPPPAPHPTIHACAMCHPDTVMTDGTIDLSRGRHIDGFVDVIRACSQCHGNDDNPAPPVSVSGSSDTDDPAVGAHQAHLSDGSLRKAVDCRECHVVPLMINAPGHVDESPAEVTFGGLATAEGAVVPGWDRETDTCASTYCHGATLGGGSNTTPQWTVVDGTQAVCGACHGFPPPRPHPTDTDCFGCHADTVTEAGAVDVAGERHINGVVDIAGVMACNRCHGSAANAAPPVSLAGEGDTSFTEVGAHQSHVVDGAVRAAVSCTECHVMPATVGDATHMDPAPAEVTWGDLATAHGVEPAWDRDANTCATTYCHGATLSGGATLTPVWTTVDGSQATCGSCHGYPPPAPHPDSFACDSCHADTVRGDGTIDVAGGKHIDGVIDISGGAGCSGCHGDDDSSAPPRGLNGETQTTDLAVGAHTSHLTDGAIRQAVDCSECHVVPDSIGAAGHMDPSPAELTWGALATTGDVVPAWNRGAATCATTYCHGATLAGGFTTTPVWTTVDGSQTGCFSCHGFPPPPPHPAETDCRACHPATVTAAGTIDVAGGQHIDGDVDLEFEGACDVCHGSAANAAPPVSLMGATSTDDIAVGAHQVHLIAGTVRGPIACDECHVVPETVGAPGHLDAAPADLRFGTLATARGANPAWNRGAATCTNTYCHGAVSPGGQVALPLWTRVDGSQLQCDSCHGDPPPPPHPPAFGSPLANSRCYPCHPFTLLPGDVINVESGAHIDGDIDVYTHD